MSGISERIQRLTDAKAAGEEFAVLFRRLSTDMPPPREMESAGSYARRLCSMLAAYDGKLSLGTLNWKAMAGDFDLNSIGGDGQSEKLIEAVTALPYVCALKRRLDKDAA